MSDKARAVSIVADPPGRMARRCFVVLRDCWTVGITRGIKSAMSLSYVYLKKVVSKHYK